MIQTITKSRLTQEVVEKVKGNPELMALIAKNEGVHLSSVFRWLYKSDAKLCQPHLVALIKENLSIEGEITETYSEEKVDKKSSKSKTAA